MTMKVLVNMCVCGMLALAATSGGVLAQSATGAEARLKEKNITLPAVPPPVANYVDSVQGGLRDSSASWTNHVSESTSRAW
jgi:hypothetical protein